MMNEYSLEMVNINKSFHNMKALDDAYIRIRPGSVHALLGINGAGKSTMIKILSGIYTKDSGDIFINGERVQINGTQDAFECGISTVYQYPELVESFTGYENIYLGDEDKKVNRPAMREKAQKLADTYGIDIDVSREVSYMKPVEQELICILKALSRNNVKILILDEPTSLLTEKEKETLFTAVRRLKETGISIIFITHRLDEVFEICDEMTIFRDGVTQAVLPVDEQVTADHVVELMLGRKLERVYPPKSECGPGEVSVELTGVSYGSRLKDVDLKAHKGVILGVFGLVGSGLDELSKVMFGALKKTSGEVEMHGEKCSFGSPRDAMDKSIFLLPGNKLTEGIIADQSIASNITISAADRVAWKPAGIINEKKKNELTRDMIRRLSIATTDGKKPVGQLSGGNQQKVVVGKGLFMEADIYLFCEPTIGVDVGAKANIYEIMREVSKEHSVVLLSSDIEEVYGLADEIMVLCEGRVTMRKPASDTSLNEMLVYALTGTQTS